MLSEDTLMKLKNFLLSKVITLQEDDCYYPCDDYDCEDEDTLYDIMYKCEADNIAWGASKAVLFFDDLKDWVFKVPFFGVHNIDTDEYRDFSCADEFGGNDYCRVEADLAEDADGHKVGQHFAHTYYIMRVNGVPFYASEKIEETLCNMGYDEIEASDISREQADDLEESYDVASIGMWSDTVALFIEKIGMAETERLLKFLFDYEIGDLHRGNIGVDKNGNLKIIDYSNYND